VRRDDFADARVLDEAPAVLADGQALLAVERFGITANVITYAVTGDAIGYWRFFPASEDGWGRIPAWGFAEVVASASDALDEGERLFGYLPMASHVCLTPEERGGAVVDTAKHRAELPPVYNRYRRVAEPPSGGMRVSSSVIAMVLNLGAYAAEIVRAGLEGTPRGQVEAARSLALTEAQVFLRVVLPPALGRVWPALASQVVIVMLGSAVCGQIATQELSYYANLIQSRNFRAFEATLVATAMYLALAVAVRQALAWAGPRWLFGRVPGARR